jgi:hypothetical protein
MINEIMITINTCPINHAAQWWWLLKFSWQIKVKPNLIHIFIHKFQFATTVNYIPSKEQTPTTIYRTDVMHP